MANFHDLLGRLGLFAIIDIVGTIIGTELLIWFFIPEELRNFKLQIVAMIFAFSGAIFIHALFRISTPLNRMILRTF